MERDRIIYDKIIALVKKENCIDYNILIETIEVDLRDNYPKYGKTRVKSYVENLKNHYFIGYSENEEGNESDICIRRDFNYELLKKKDEVIEPDIYIDNFPDITETIKPKSISIFKSIFSIIGGIFSWIFLIFLIGVFLLFMVGLGTVIMPVIGIMALGYFVFLFLEKKS